MNINSSSMLHYPNRLNLIFDKLLKNNIQAVIVGGFVRDALLNKESKDIDIELYGLTSFSELEGLLEEFGDVNSVGKSFGVCKLKLFDLDLDFSFPRRDSKIFSGHKGFDIEINSTLDFTEAARRRDFTINAIGYDVKSKTILDPYHGVDDLKAKILRAVDLSKFDEDPLRVLRAVQLSARFGLTLHEELLKLCKTMIQNHVMNELPKERIFEEIKKLLLNSSTVSNGVVLLKELGAFEYFSELKSLDERQLHETLYALDRAYRVKLGDAKVDIVLMLAVLTHLLTLNECSSFVAKLTNEKRLVDSVRTLVALKEGINLENFSDYDLYILATKVTIRYWSLFQEVVTTSKRGLENLQNLEKEAKRLNIFQSKAEALLKGRDIISLGIKPSREFSLLLDKAYEAQMSGSFYNHEDALLWLEKELDSAYRLKMLSFK